MTTIFESDSPSAVETVDASPQTHLQLTTAFARAAPSRSRTISLIDGALALFALSALVGAAIAADGGAAWRKFGLIVGGLAVYYALVHLPEMIDSVLGKRCVSQGMPGDASGLRRTPSSAGLETLAGDAPHASPPPEGSLPKISSRSETHSTIAAEPASLRWSLAVLPALIAVYLLATAGWAAWQGERPGALAYAIHPNAAGGMIAGLLPLQLAALLSGAPTRRRLVLGGALLGTAGLGLLASATRGAWLALALALSGWGWRRLSGGRARWVATLAMAVALLAAGVWATPLGVRFVEGLGGRPALWRNSIDLGRDYLFSGLGLAGFEMAYSTYALLVHVGFLTHAHNLFLDIWLEQGIVGEVAWVGLLSAAVRLAGRENIWRGPALAALATITLHGLVDDAFYGYDGCGILLLFTPLAILARGAWLTGGGEAQDGGGKVRRTLGLSALALMLVLLLLPGTRAAAQANLGAVLQTRAELSLYRWPTWPLQDALRRSPQVDLAPAIARYQAALALDPGNVTAHRRLGQIELARGEAAAACRHLEAAYVAAPGQRATRQLLGESYAIAGDLERAAALWRTVDVSQQQLELRRWWYEHLGEKERAQWIQQAARQAAADLANGSN